MQKNNKVVCIGDIHGHYDQLLEIMFIFMNRDDIDFDRDTFVFIGDYVDGGPDTKAVLDELILYKEQWPHWKFLFGNHESLLLDAFNPKHPIYRDYYLWWTQGGKETVDSFKPDQSLGYSSYELSLMQPKDLITEEYLNFIKGLDFYYENDDYFFVHGGLHPERSIESHTELADKITPEAMRQGDMAYDLIWMREPFISSRYDWGKKIIFGHTIDDKGKHNPGTLFPQGGLYPIVKKNKIGIDTFRHNHGRLTAVILPDEEFVFSKFLDE